MKKLLLMAGLVLLSANIMAGDKTYGGNPDMYASPLLDHDKGHPFEAADPKAVPDPDDTQFLVNKKSENHAHPTYSNAEAEAIETDSDNMKFLTDK